MKSRKKLPVVAFDSMETEFPRIHDKDLSMDQKSYGIFAMQLSVATVHCICLKDNQTKKMSQHTGSPLPTELYDFMLNSRSIQSFSDLGKVCNESLYSNVVSHQTNRWC